MTTKALIAATPWSADKAKAGMVDFATAGRGTLGDRSVRVIAEQLLRGGPRRQAIRVEVDGLTELRAADVQLRTGGGSPVPVEGVDGPAGSLRLLVPAVDAPTAFRLAIPALAADDPTGPPPAPRRGWSTPL